MQQLRQRPCTKQCAEIAWSDGAVAIEIGEEVGRSPCVSAAETVRLKIVFGGLVSRFNGGTRTRRNRGLLAQLFGWILGDRSRE